MPTVHSAPLPVQSPRMPHLHFRGDGRHLFVHLLRGGRTLVGRSDRCDVALPSDTVSRTHCAIEGRSDGWWVVDRSSHGTSVNGKTVERHPLRHGDVVTIGEYEATFSTEVDPVTDRAATAAPMRPATHEQLVDVAAGRVISCRAEITLSRGPLEGQKFVVERGRATVGGKGADVVIDERLSRDAVRMRVVRGRVLVEPTDTAVFLAGTRVREITPALIGEEIRVGDHGFTVNVATVDERPSDLPEFGGMVGTARVMRDLFGILARMAAHDDPVLLVGESGTGKELAARALHDAGPRYERPFVAVNCAAITDSLFESELFGHEKGSFTGATQRQDGAFQQAHGGTLFLDEIGELRLDAQAKLLRSLESGEVRRVGASSPEYPDVRVVAATNRDLVAMVRDGTFRSDLYFRLAVLTVRMPALRERAADIGAIAQRLLDRMHPGAVIDADAIRLLATHDWPGNVRELRNVVTRAFVMHGPAIAPGAIQFHPWSFDGERPPSMPQAAGLDPERRMIEDALRRHGGNRTRTAQDLAMPRSSLLYRMRRMGIDGA